VSSSQIFAAEALLRSVHEMAESFALNASARELPLIHADPYLNNLLLKYCEATITGRRGNVSQLRTRVENAISSLLPHGRVVVDDVARSLGMSKRTLARRLSDEGLNFTEVLQQLRRYLAVRYLDDPKLHISKIAWLLGFNEVSAFTHAFKRWTGKTPSQMRIGSAGATQDRWPFAPSAMASSSGEC
jgi:AraC-like DNA-binding protein